MFWRKLLSRLWPRRPLEYLAFNYAARHRTVNPKPDDDPFPDYLYWSWSRRKAKLLDNATDWFDGGFAAANCAFVEQIATATGQGAQLHVIFNIGADALVDYMKSDDYKNIYERPVVGSRTLEPSAVRIKVDQMIGLVPPANFYFCAASVGGTGMRFYGEYCVVLKSPDDALSVTRVLDRNSYDFIKAPLNALFASGRPHRAIDPERLTEQLMCEFRSDDFADMLAIKVLQHHASRPRLLTTGSIGQAVLADEDYVELFHEGKIRKATILEVRSHPDDEVTEMSIDRRWSQGSRVSPHELLWVGRRQMARAAMESESIRHRVMSGSGRPYRWS